MKELSTSRVLMSASRILGGVLLASVLLQGCSSQGKIVNPFERRLVWFSHISGEDVRTGCTDATPDRYRLTYYANRARQVRVYEVNLPPENSDGDLVPPSTGAGIPDGLVAVAVDVLDGPVDFTRVPIIDDILRPWKPKRREFTITPDVMQEIRFDMIESGVTKGAPVGRVLASPSFFWLAAACIDGAFYFQVWEHPDPDFRALAFPTILFGRDGSSVPPLIAPAGEERIVNYTDPRRQELVHRDIYNHYDLIVEAQGVATGNTYPRR